MHPEIARQIGWEDRYKAALVATTTSHHRSSARWFPRRPARTEDR